MNSWINQEALTYSLELTYSMRCFDHTGVHTLEISQYYKKQFLAGQFLVELQPPHRMAHNIHFCYEKTTVWSTIETASGKWNPWSNPPCQQGNKLVKNNFSHTHTHTHNPTAR
jgi:hypothetical protein